MSIWPLSGVYTPDSIFIKVLFPAPFSPRRAYISPFPTLKSIASFASTVPNRFVSDLVSKYDGSGIKLAMTLSFCFYVAHYAAHEPVHAQHLRIG